MKGTYFITCPMFRLLFVDFFRTKLSCFVLKSCLSSCRLFLMKFCGNCSKMFSIFGCFYWGFSNSCNFIGNWFTSQLKTHRLLLDMRLKLLCCYVFSVVMFVIEIWTLTMEISRRPRTLGPQDDIENILYTRMYLLTQKYCNNAIITRKITQI